MGGKHFKNDKAFIKTAVSDVQRLEKYCGLDTSSSLLDWGCGAGRLAVGVREHFGQIRDYHGVDIQAELIDWANENLTGPGFRFTHVNVSNERYNPDGSPERTLAAAPGTVDVFYAYSVFSHMNDEDTQAYLKLIEESLSTHGRAFVTCFVEENEVFGGESLDYLPARWIDVVIHLLGRCLSILTHAWANEAS
jgi:cyclopropane fatty-acyl-phospholipid synthase-like methyltransferase